VIPSRYPEKNVFDRVASLQDLEALLELEEITNQRKRLLRRETSAVPIRERVSGPGSHYIMAAFTYLNPAGSRFSDGTYGVYYAARTLPTAIKESRYHRENFMRATDQKPMRLGMRVVVAKMDGRLHDLRAKRKTFRKIYSRTSYVASQIVGKELWKKGSAGLLYKSVRDRRGECAGIFRPTVLSHCRQERHLSFEWNGTSIKKIFELREHPLAPTKS
jgi:hypothetical protein